MSSVRDALEELGIEDVPLIAVSKGPDRNAGREVFHFPDGREKTLPVNSPVLFHLQRLRRAADAKRRYRVNIHIALAESHEEIAATWPVMHELRLHLDAHCFSTDL